MSLSISVVIPFYYAEEFFKESLNSVLNQTVTVNEIIVVNDGCGQSTEDYLAKFPEINVINLPDNQGPSIARNTGIKAAKGEWIAFLDADDLWEPNKLELQIQFLEQNPQFTACHTGIETFNNKGAIRQFTDKPFDLTIEDLLVSSHVTPPSLMIKKTTLESVNFFDQTIKCSEDHDLSMRLILAGHKIGFLDQVLTKVRRMNHGNISSNGRRIFIGHGQLIKKHRDIFNAHPKLKHLFIYKNYMTAGNKSLGLEKKYYYFLGYLIQKAYKIEI
ncbi:glycosyltransferase family 2 protein [Thalassotalea piscium]